MPLPSDCKSSFTSTECICEETDHIAFFKNDISPFSSPKATI